MLSLKDKVVFMSGAGSVGDDLDAKVWGNGKATAVLLARQGAKIYGVDVRKEAVDGSPSTFGTLPRATSFAQCPERRRGGGTP